MAITIKSNSDGVSGAIQVNGVDAFAFGNGAQFSFRNKIINGAFAIKQRAYVSGAATSAGQYTLDRWKVTGTGGITFSNVNNKTTVTIPAGQTLQQVIEGLNLATGTYVLSWEGTAQGRIGGGSYGASGTVTASITGGTNTTIEFNTGTVANVQLEAGSISTSFEHRPYGMELSLCQRYYQKSFDGNTPITLAGLVEVFNSSGAINTASLSVVFKVTMRIAPTVTAYSPTTGASGYVYDGSGSDRSASVTNVGTGSAKISNSAGGSAASYSAHWTASAEL